ncbi:MAG: sugar transferase [Candidatus Gastranaerophilaceae bacterium]
MFVENISQQKVNCSYIKIFPKRITFSGLKLPKKNVVQSVFSKEENKLLEHYAEVYNFAKDKPIQWKLKRFMDYAGASVLLTLSSPIILVAEGFVKLESKGPAIFKQKRVGKMGKEFTIYKIRTMYDNKHSDQFVASPNGQRITKVGKILRKYSIDELPQFLNILKGDMSLIGPRPLVKKDVDNLLKVNPNGIMREVVPPGTKIKFKDIIVSKSNPKSRMEEEKEYLDNWSLRNDIKIFFSVFKNVIRGENI